MNTRLLAAMLCCGLASALLALISPSASGAAYVWNFDSSDLAIAPGSSNGAMDYRGSTAPLTFFEITGSAYPHINGQPARYLRHDAWPTPAANDTTLGYDLTFDDSGPNGGGDFINQYTFIIDILIPSALDYVPIFQTDPDMNFDADWYIAPDGSFGIGLLGYTAPGLLTTNTWYRLGFVASLDDDDVRYYLNGALVHTTTETGLLDDTRFSLLSNADPGPHLVLFNENDASGNYTHAGVYNSIGFFDLAFTSAQMNALGGPTAAGIPVPEPESLMLLSVAGAIFLSHRRNVRRSLARATWDDQP